MSAPRHQQPEERELELETFSAAQAFKVALPHFEGPLDLLLHLIREHKLDILDIPISLIADRYLAYLDAMQALDIDLAAEFLVMAATLAHLKSRMLLPREANLGQASSEEEGEGEDPRAALVRRLLEYQKYKDAGANLGSRSLLGRDIFPRPPSEEDPAAAESGFEEVSVFKLVEAFDGILKRSRLRVPLEVAIDRLSLSEAIQEVAERLRTSGRQTFAELVASAEPGGKDLPIDRHRLVIVFLALLEMVKLRMLRILVPSGENEIAVALRGEGGLPQDEGALKDDYRS